MPVAMRRRWTKGLLKYLWRNKRPDLDKLVRAVFDGVVESGLIKDDAQFVHLVTGKVHSAQEGGGGGVSIFLSSGFRVFFGGGWGCRGFGF